MAQIILNIPDPLLPRVIDGICKQHRYSATLEDGTSNPETRPQFARRMLIQWVRRTVQKAEIEEARNLAATEAAERADEIVIT